jgi:prepilin-type processing-associated H-X9-DG protein
MTKRVRVGLSLVELLVVIAIIAVLIAISLPAVHSVRESARRTDCQNRLRQVGLACQNFESSRGFFPSGGWGFRWIADPTRGYGRRQPGGWPFHIAAFCELKLPQLQHNDPFEKRRWITTISETPFPLLRCPSRPAGEFTPATRDFFPANASFVALVPKTDYAANEGDYITNTLGGPDSLAEGDDPAYAWTLTDRASGVIFQRSEIRHADVKDGLAHTYLVGEKYVSRNHYSTSGDDGYDQSVFSGVDVDLNRWTHVVPMRDGESIRLRAFGSAHGGTFGMVFCDGHVATISYSIDLKVHRAAGTRNAAD